MIRLIDVPYLDRVYKENLQELGIDDLDKLRVVKGTVISTTSQK